MQVRARNVDGEGPWSRTATARTLVNRPPAFSDDIAPTHSVELTENAAQVVKISASDPDTGDTVTYELAGEDEALFERRIVQGRSWLFFKTAPDFEAPGSAANTNTYEVTVTAAGGDGTRRLTVSADITVTVTDVDEPPAFSGPAAFEVAENTALAGAVAAAEPDAGDTVRYTLGGTDAGLFRIAGGGRAPFPERARLRDPARRRVRRRQRLRADGDCGRQGRRGERGAGPDGDGDGRAGAAGAAGAADPRAGDRDDPRIRVAGPAEQGAADRGLRRRVPHGGRAGDDAGSGPGGGTRRGHDVDACEPGVRHRVRGAGAGVQR